jgi:hypothetical protein
MDEVGHDRGRCGREGWQPHLCALQTLHDAQCGPARLLTCDGGWQFKCAHAAACATWQQEVRYQGASVSAPAAAVAVARLAQVSVIPTCGIGHSYWIRAGAAAGGVFDGECGREMQTRAPDYRGPCPQDPPTVLGLWEIGEADIELRPLKLL